MFGSAILEVGLGLVTTFLLMSLIVTQINNVISWTLKLKSRLLYRYIEQTLLKGDLSSLLSHPLLDARQTDGDIKRDATQIDPDAFAQALSTASVERLTRTLVNLADGVDKQALQRVGAELLLELENPAYTLENLQKLKQKSENLPGGAVKHASIAEINEMIVVVGAYQQSGEKDARIALLEREVKNMDDYVLRTSLSLLLESVKDFDDAIKRLAGWFDEQIAATSHIYERYMGVISFGVGLLLAIALNVDALHISNTLYQDADLRQTIVAFTEENLAEIETLIASDETAVAATQEPVADDDALPELRTDDLEDSASDFQVVLDLLTESQLPIGWEAENRSVSVGRVIGWLVTAAATTLGAPFWFNLIKRPLDRSKSQPSSTRTTPETPSQ